MRILGKQIGIVVFLLLVSLFTAIPSSTAEIISMKLQSDNRSVIKLSEFNLTHNNCSGHISIAISSVSVVTSNLSHEQPDCSRIGFIFVSDEIPPEFRERGPNNCILDSKLISVLFTLQDVSNNHDHDLFNKSYPVTYPGMNYLYLVNCNAQSVVTMDIRTEYFYNSTTKDYLTYMPYRYYLVFSLIYLCFLVLWIWFKNERVSHTMHTLMAVLLVITSAHLMNASAERHFYVKIMHTPDHGWDALFYLLQFIRSELFFTVIMLIGSGWCFWKPGLQGMDMLILIALIVLQFFGYLASITMAADTTSQYTDELKAVIFRADYACCVFMFVPMVCSILSLRDEVRETEGNNAAAAAARNLEKLWVFVKVALLYVFFTRIVIVIGLAPLVAHKCPWVIQAVKETAELVLCMVMYYIYRPLEENVNVRDIDQELGL